MEIKPLFYSCIVLSVIVFLEVLINSRKNSFLKLGFLAIIASLFVMNYFAYIDIASRAQFILVKAMRSLYLCSALLVILHLLTSKIPRWVIVFLAVTSVFFLGIRLYFYDQIDISKQLSGGHLVFSVNSELLNPQPWARVLALCVLLIATGLTIYYYRQFSRLPYKENIYYRRLSAWIISLIFPFLVLVIFAILMILNIFQRSFSPYLYSFFSCTIILSILFRPKFLNTAHAGLAFFPIQKQVGPALSPQLFNKVVFFEFYYLDKDASLAQLAEKVQTTETNMREYLQQEYGMGINDFLNKYRISYMLDLLNDPKNREFTIEHLSQKSGFPSRSTMYRAFSKFHGGHPSDYIKELNR